MKKLIAMMLALVLVLGLVACGAKEEPAAAPAAEAPAAPAEELKGCCVSKDSNIVVATSGDMVTFQPINAANTMDGGVQKLMSDGLVGFDRNYNLIWLLAAGYEANEEATEYTFFLRKGITFQDGAPWNAEAAKANLDIMADQSNGYKKNSNYRMIDTVEVVDEYTVKLNLKYPFGAMVNYLAHPSAVMVSPKQLAEAPETVETAMIGCGQYSLKEWRPGESWVLELNREWWGYDEELCGGEPIVAPNAGFNSITFKPITEAATRVAMMLSGEAQFSPVSSTYVEALKNGGKTVKYADNGLSITYLYMNNQKEVFKDKRVRQAFNMAIDIDAMMQVVDNGTVLRADSYISGPVSYYSSQADKLYKYDVEAAKALMAEAGYPDGFEVTLWSQNSTASVQRAEFVQQQLALIGVKVNVVPQENGVLSSGVSGYSGDPAVAEFDMYLRGFSPSTGDADQGLVRFSTSMFTPAGSNYCYFSNEEYDALVEAGAATADPDERADLYAKAQALIWEEAPCVPMVVSLDGFVYDQTVVEDMCYYPDGSPYFRDGVYVK